MSGEDSMKQSSDPRFSGIYSDPKFKNSKRKNIKIKLDDRFDKSDLQIKHKSKVDKYGRKLKDVKDNKELEDFDKYFEKEDEEDKEEEIGTEAKVKVLDRARGEVPSDYESSSEEFTSSDSESSGESEVDSDEESEDEVETSKPESGDSSKTLAVVNLDWDYVKSQDLMITFSSFLPKGGKIEKICIYPSEFGKERMAREEVEGPPRELFNKKKNKKSSKKSSKDDDEDDESDSDVDIRELYEEGDAEKDVDSKALRQYQLERLRYYYAVVYCNNIASAESIYENCDGTEYESSANIFDLRYVPDGTEFDDEPRDECLQLPKNYKVRQFTTDALQHSNVKLTWDETPADRVEIAKRAFTQKEIEEMDFKAYLASDSDESEEEPNDDVKNKLKSLVSQSTTIGDKSIFDDKGDNNEEDDVDMEITFTPGLGEGGEDGDEDKDNEETTIEKVRRKEKERRKARKDKLKQLKQQSENEKKEKLKELKKERNGNGKNTNVDAKAKAELELLMMDDETESTSTLNKKAHFNMNEIVRSEKEKGKKSKYQDKNKIVEDDFKPDLNDPRFKEIFEDHDFAIDPTQSEFKETTAMKEILKERSRRSNKNKSNNKRKHLSSNDNNQKKNISNLVDKIKRKEKKMKHK
ncbi:hypothetical protein Kpol_1016p8 [Vanderwaltozyma polyspora DSM 70294]|uniref:Uncharacterized protein n=1 Tax=Vanderwaltozyma polyspora (strain ATCC 22028 / DSM 70294 / BCRC 21397 / CBS 2163 / NBRC 10782 / NRRL Y-8283 / UCD 57-17) TaxID=436907 RepID=A7TNS5_VANPO|nr:uncharacterized protein Kpol_1016p8 [Vanderwaltozyma polyspora DSM 70294]EDO16068.1 hypothetical protein Kpol_1016p8 [Vanderwaltozyma polyspora DSM 70294]